MFTCYNFMVPENHKPWKSAYEIEIEAREHENMRLRMMHEYAEVKESRQGGLLSFLKAPLHLLSTLTR